MKKKLLIIPAWQVWPLQSGGAHAQTFSLTSLSKTLEVHIILTSQNTENIEDFRIHFPDIIVHYLSEKSTKTTFFLSIKQRAINFLKSLIYLVTNEKLIKPSLYETLVNRLSDLYRVNQKVSDKIEELDKVHNYDYVQYEMEFNIPLIFQYQPKGKSILVLHEVTSKIIQQNLSLLQNPKNRYHDVLKEAFEHYERQNLPLFDKIITFNKSDREAILNHTNHSSIVVSGYTIPHRKDRFDPSLSDINLQFIGSGHHYPNYQGLRWFLEEVWPILIDKKPNLKLFITGQWQLSFKNRYKFHSQVYFLGNISEESLNQLLVHNLMISPIFIGSGLRTKILEGLSLGVPIISTYNEKNMIEAMEDGVNCYLRQTPSEFFEAIIELLNNEEQRRTISKNALCLFENNFNFLNMINNRMQNYL